MNFKKVCELTINGKKWKLGYGFPGSTNRTPDDACCIYDERKIIINRRACRSLVNALAHEILHARFPDINEDAVEEFGNLVSEAHDLFSKLPSPRPRR